LKIKLFSSFEFSCFFGDFFFVNEQGLLLVLPANGAGGRGLDLAVVQELRVSIERFRACGKMTMSWAASFGDGGTGM